MFVSAQELTPTSWTAYGLVFDAPRGIRVEEDTEDTYLLNSTRYYISVQTLNTDDIPQEDYQELLASLASEDGIKGDSAIVDYDLSQFRGMYLKGMIEEDSCYYALLVTKEAGSVFFVSIIYNKVKDEEVEKILKSFKMEE